jgi:hypothetical protein
VKIDRDDIRPDQLAALAEQSQHFAALTPQQQKYCILWVTAPETETTRQTAHLAGYAVTGPSGAKIQNAIKEIATVTAELDQARAALVTGKIISRISAELDAGRSPATITRTEAGILQHAETRLLGPLPKAAPAAAGANDQGRVNINNVYALEMSIDGPGPQQPTSAELETPPESAPGRNIVTDTQEGLTMQVSSMGQNGPVDGPALREMTAEQAHTPEDTESRHPKQTESPHLGKYPGALPDLDTELSRIPPTAAADRLHLDKSPQLDANQGASTSPAADPKHLDTEPAEDRQTIRPDRVDRSAGHAPADPGEYGPEPSAAGQAGAAADFLRELSGPGQAVSQDPTGSQDK